jgi:serine/threonine protein phosphatase PrpC
MKMAGKTDIGAVRSENQDNYRAALLPDGTAWALVCDGMGGARGGKIASGIACDTVEQWFADTLSACAAGQENEYLFGAMNAANTAIFARAAAEPRYAGMGTTAVAALVRGGTAHLCHVGDSRCYLLRGGRLVQLTHDHSYVQELVDSGSITPQEAEHHPRKNVITRALGVEESVRPEYTCATLAAGDILLLCSDGLTNAVSKNRIEQILNQQTVYDAADSLIDEANASGGPDNITALLLDMDTEETNG